MRQTGLVLLFRIERGYGFIRTDAGSSIFFHVNEVHDHLTPDDKVGFQTGAFLKATGRVECVDVELIGRAPKAVQS